MSPETKVTNFKGHNLQFYKLFKPVKYNKIPDCPDFLTNLIKVINLSKKVIKSKNFQKFIQIPVKYAVKASGFSGIKIIFFS